MIDCNHFCLSQPTSGSDSLSISQHIFHHTYENMPGLVFSYEFYLCKDKTISTE